MKDDISLVQVRAIMESLAKKEGCGIEDIEIKPVQAVLNKWNNGTVGAYVKQVKQEFINSKSYDRANISMQLKSSLIEEINRFVDDARQSAREGIACLERDFDEVLKMNAECREIIDTQNSEIAARQEKTGQELRQLHDELTRREQIIATHIETEAQLRKDLETSRKDLVQAHLAAAELNRMIGGLETEVISIRSDREELAKRLTEAEKALSDEKTASALNVQALAHQKEAYNLLSLHKATLENSLVELNIKLESVVAAKNKELHEKIEQLTKEHITDLKQLKQSKPPSGNKQ